MSRARLLFAHWCGTATALFDLVDVGQIAPCANSYFRAARAFLDANATALDVGSP